jgi:hypothetical protein
LSFVFDTTSFFFPPSSTTRIEPSAPSRSSSFAVPASAVHYTFCGGRLVREGFMLSHPSVMAKAETAANRIADAIDAFMIPVSCSMR